MTSVPIQFNSETNNVGAVLDEVARTAMSTVIAKAAAQQNQKHDEEMEFEEKPGGPRPSRTIRRRGGGNSSSSNPSQTNKSSDWVVEVQKNGTLGLSLTQDGDKISVTAVKAGLIADHNEKYPEKMVNVGDHVLQVNGTSNASDLVGAIRAAPPNSFIKMTFRRKAKVSNSLKNSHPNYSTVSTDFPTDFPMPAPAIDLNRYTTEYDEPGVVYNHGQNNTWTNSNNNTQESDPWAPQPVANATALDASASLDPNVVQMMVANMANAAFTQPMQVGQMVFVPVHVPAGMVPPSNAVTANMVAGAPQTAQVGAPKSPQGNNGPAQGGYANHQQNGQMYNPRQVNQMQQMQQQGMPQYLEHMGMQQQMPRNQMQQQQHSMRPDQGPNPPPYFAPWPQQQQEQPNQDRRSRRSTRSRRRVEPVAPEEGGKVFVGGLGPSSSSASLRKYFSKYGRIIDCAVLADGTTKRSRGFGFVEFAERIPEGVTDRDHIIDQRRCGVRPYHYAPADGA